MAQEVEVLVGEELREAILPPLADQPDRSIRIADQPDRSIRIANQPGRSESQELVMFSPLVLKLVDQHQAGTSCVLSQNPMG